MLEKKITPDPIWTGSFILIGLANLFLFMNIQLLLPSLPVFILSIGCEQRAIGLVMGAFTIAAMAMRPVAGLLLDRCSRKTVLLAGIAATMAVSTMYHFTSALLLIVLIRLAHGAAYSISTTATGTIVSSLLPTGRLAEGMGYFGITSSISMAVSPLLGLWLVEQAGFNYLFNSSAVLALLALGMGLLSDTSRAEPVAGRPPAGKVTIDRFALFEKQALPAALVMFFLATVFGAFIFYVSLHAAERGVTKIGLFFTSLALGMMILRPFAGRWMDRRGANYPVLVGLILTACSALAVSRSFTLAGFAAAGFLYGLSFGFCMPSLQALAVRDVPLQKRGAATGTFFSALDLGIGLGAVIWGLVVEHTGYEVMYLLTLVPVGMAGLAYLATRAGKPAAAHLDFH